ncbi:MAG TPA: FixH family protein [Longimicrobium sp.]|nr:FixH family protein [Longimicrobium sp.]
MTATFGGAMLLALSAAASIRANPLHPPAATVPDAYLSLSARPSRHGVYTAGVVERRMDPGAAETWMVRVTDAAGRPVNGAELRVRAWMPDGGVRMDANAVTSERMGGGLYRIGGMRFSRAGWWTVPVRVTVGGRTDRVVFNLIVPPAAVGADARGRAG